MASQQQQEQQEQQTQTQRTQEQQRLTEFRVAQAELVSGNTTGKVYVRLSDGAAAYLTDRPKAKAHVSNMLRREILKDETTVDENKN
mmetsp:Transcript_27868/g.46090  ORF Transcript_27868/g.46090 Transcript_27868/m.46090 type:complete len:87 (+) Transcript_27868:177-437(+)